MVLHRDEGELLACGAVAFHVSLGAHGVERREGGAEEALVLHVGRGGQGERGLVAADVRHLFHAADEDYVRCAAGDLDPAGSQGGGAGTARRFDPRGRTRPGAQRVSQKRAQVLLAVEQAAGHAAYDERVDVVHARVAQRGQRGFGEDVAQRALPELAELAGADANDGYVSHRLFVPLDLLAETGVFAVLDVSFGTVEEAGDRGGEAARLGQPRQGRKHEAVAACA